MLTSPLKLLHGRRPRLIFLTLALSGLFAALLYISLDYRSLVASGSSLDGPLAQVTPTTVTGLYRNTTEGFSIQLPPGWQGVTADKPTILVAQNRPSNPTAIAEVWVFRTSEVEDAGTWLDEQLADYEDGASITTGQSPSAAPDTTVSQKIVDYTQSGSTIREVWTAYQRGTQIVMVRAYALRSTYNSISSQMSAMFNSFTFEVPAPFGASQSDSLFLAGGDIRTIDPALYRGSADSVVGALFSGLVKLNDDLEVEPDIASSWDIDSTGTVYTFHINPQAKFHDGRQITASDVKYSWERAASPGLESPTVRSYLGDIVGVDEMLDGDATEISGLQVVNSTTLKVTIDSPKVYFIEKLTYPTTYIVDHFAVEAGGDDWTKAPNGSGRFKLKVWEEDDLLILERFDDYHLGAAKLKNIVYQLFAGIPLSMYESGEIDITGVNGADVERAQDPENPLHNDLIEGVGMCTSFLYLNPTEPPFDDINVRKAFAESIDIDKYLAVTLKGQGDRATSILPPGMPGYVPDQFSVDYDPAAAKQLLEQTDYYKSGYFSDPLLSYGASSTFLWMWHQNLGVDFTAVNLPEPDDAVKRNDNSEIPFGQSGWCADYPDPQNFLEILMGSDSDQNTFGYSNPDVDALLKRAASEPDEETRLGLYSDAEKMVLDDWVFIPYGHPRYYTLVKPYVKNYVDLPIGVQIYHELEIDR